MSKRWPKIWGWNEELIRNDICSLNVLHVEKGGQCSLHTHKHNHNLFYVVSGKLRITTEHGNVDVESGQNFLILPGTQHQFTGLEESKVVEFVFVQFDPSDIDRSTQGRMIKKPGPEMPEGSPLEEYGEADVGDE